MTAQQTSKAQQSTASLSAADIEKYLAGGDFPMNKSELQRRAKGGSAPKEVLRLLNELPGGQYNDAADVAQALSRTSSGQSGYTGVKTLEQGDIFFFYQPKVEEQEPAGKSDVQQLYMVLHPKDQDRYRHAIIGGKQLPDPEKHGRPAFGFIETADDDPATVRKALQGETYQTKTRGERSQPGARPAGEGVYRIVGHEDHTNLIYSLELPDDRGSVQKQMNLAAEASFVISIRNPERDQPRAPGLQAEDQADYPDDLRSRFQGRKFADADPPKYLDYEGCELLLIAASGDVSEELGIDLDPEKESQKSADVFNVLRMDQQKTTRQPLTEGQWQ